MARKTKSFTVSFEIDVNINDKQVVASLIKRSIENALSSDHTNQFMVGYIEIKETK